MRNFKHKNIIKIISVLLVSLILLLLFGFIFWTSHPYPASNEALSALTSNRIYTVDKSKWLVFKPTYGYNSGVIFYPGALIDANAYAPICQFLADEGHLCVITPMPFNLAIFGIDKADDVRAEFKDVHYWVIAGHSLGGAMAARYVKSHLDNKDVKGLALLGAYSDQDLSNADILVDSFYATNDKVFSRSTWESTKKNLPEKYTEFIEIEGGNHSQFGYYGIQSGDGEATISHEEQFRIIDNAIHEMLPEH